MEKLSEPTAATYYSNNQQARVLCSSRPIYASAHPILHQTRSVLFLVGTGVSLHEALYVGMGVDPQSLALTDTYVWTHTRGRIKSTSFLCVYGRLYAAR